MSVIKIGCFHGKRDWGCLIEPLRKIPCIILHQSMHYLNQGIKRLSLLVNVFPRRNKMEGGGNLTNFEGKGGRQFLNE